MDNQADRYNFPEQEEKILAFWEEIRAFETSLELSADRPKYSFYDGPPFATGLPHYGHILAGTVKDVVTRHACQLGYFVERRFGWDTHGLPIEYEIDKKLGISRREEILALGIDKYNQECRNIVLRYSAEWETTVKRTARWIDFRNDYKTMDPTFMESVWWVFGQLFAKGQVYRGYRVMPYSCVCTTPLSNFEANQNYKDTTDPSVVVSFTALASEPFEFLIWTTTPWTLYANLAVCVNAGFEYVKVKEISSGRVFVLLQKAISMIWKDESLVQILSTIKGSELVGLKYAPLFKTFEGFSSSGAFRVVADNFVSDESGTGIVHQAPAFGEDDFRVCLDAGIITSENIPCHIDDDGRFTAAVPEFQGTFFKDADSGIMKLLQSMNCLLYRGQITHSYPFCWRSDSPLIYKAVPSWLVRVKDIIPQLLVNNKLSYWVPEHVQEKRFHNWLENARDWVISRNRFWGTPIPLWVSEDFEEVVCVSSVQELEELSGVTGIKDLHRENIDHITIPSKQGKGVLKRVDEVFDCWFESGSMPYAQQHYPFENKEKFLETFPANFIAEGLDQTRGWFYTLLVLATHLFDKPAFKNLIVNGLVLAADGKKMSKRLKNYPEPTSVIDRYGADALRLYLINSPVVKAENLRLKEEGIQAVLKDVFLPFLNAFKFLSTQIESWEKETGRSFSHNLPAHSEIENIMDRWILATVQNLIDYVKNEMAAYRLYTVVPRLLEVIDLLTNWYVRFNRKRLKGELGMDEAHVSLQVLFDVVYSICLILAPFVPLLTENLYQTMRKWIDFSKHPEVKDSRSIHFLLYPAVKQEFCDAKIEVAVERMRTVIEMARKLRETKGISLKTPLKEMSLLVPSQDYQTDLELLRPYMLEEINVRSIKMTCNDEEFGAVYKAMPNFKLLGQRIKGDLPKVQKALTQLSSSTLKGFLASGKIEIAGVELLPEELEVVRSVDTSENAHLESTGNRDILLILNVEVDDSLKEEGLAREIVNRIQRLRKKMNLKPADKVNVHFEIIKDDENQINSVFSAQSEYISKTVKCDCVSNGPLRESSTLGSEVVEISNAFVKLSLVPLN